MQFTVLNTSNPRVFLDISINKSPPERLEIELFADFVPKTAENFRALCVGDKGIGSTTGKPLHYKGCVFHRIYKGFVAQGGDISKQNGTGGESIYGGTFQGTGGESIYGGTFPDENLELIHSGVGILSMANDGPNTNGSQFLISLSRQRYLDGCHVVFGKVIKGMETVQKIDQCGSTSGTPSRLVEITDCGELYEEKNSNLIENLYNFFNPRTSSVGKEEPEAKLQKDNGSKIYESSEVKPEATSKNNALVTNGNDMEVTYEECSSNPHQHSNDPSKSRSSYFISDPHVVMTGTQSMPSTSSSCLYARNEEVQWLNEKIERLNEKIMQLQQEKETERLEKEKERVEKLIMMDQIDKNRVANAKMSEANLEMKQQIEFLLKNIPKSLS